MARLVSCVRSEHNSHNSCIVRPSGSSSRIGVLRSWQIGLILLFSTLLPLRLLGMGSSTARVGSAPKLTSLTITTSSQLAALKSPVAGGQFSGSSVTFAWTSGANVTAYRLYLGTSGTGSRNLYNSGATTATSMSVSGLPMTGVTIYAQLSSEIRGSWKSLNYTFTAGTSKPTLRLSASSLAFGNVAMNSVSTQYLTIASTSSVPVTVSSAATSGGGFSVSGATFPLTLNAGQSATLAIQYTPAVAGAASGTLTLASNSSTGATSVVSLSGYGVPVLSAIACTNPSMKGAGTDACSVSLNAATPNSFAVSLASSNSAVAVPASVTIAPGSASASFSATVSAVSTAQTSTLTATANGISQSFAMQLNTAVPTLAVSSSSLSFGNVSVNSTTSQTITLSSTGTAAVNITSVTISGAGFSISGASFPLTLNPNQAASLTVQFDPTTAGAASGTLTIASNSSSGASDGINLSGTGVPVLSSFTCTHSSMTGAGTDACTVTLNAAAASGGYPVSLASNSSSVVVPASVTVTAGSASVGFSATASAVSTAQPVTLTAMSGGFSQSFALQLNAALPTLSFSSPSLSFGNVAVNSATSQSITLSSAGTAAVTVNSATLTGAGFSISGAIFPLTLNPNQTATLTIQFDPTAAGAATGSLTLASNSSSGASSTISLTGAGVPVLTAISCANSSMTGAGTDACSVTLNAAAATGGFTVNLLSSNSSVVVPASVTVAASSTSASFSATVSSVSTAQAVTLTATAGSASQTYALQLVASAPTLSVSSSNLSFGNVTVNTASSQTITLTSTGNATLTISSATLTGAGFSISGATFPMTLSPNQTATLTVQFDPTVAGAASGTLNLASNSSSGASTAIAMSGAGVSTPGYEVALIWAAPSNSTDPVATYNVYRSLSGSSTYQLMGSVSSGQLSYTDTNNIQSGQSYDYIVESVDASGNESVPSNMACVTIPGSSSGSGCAGAPATPVVSALSCSNASMTGSGSDTCTVTLSAAASSGGLVVDLASNNSLVVVPASITVTSGASSASFPATVTATPSAESVTLTASAASNSETFSLQLVAYVPALIVNASSVGFGDVDLNTPATQYVTLTSSGTAPVTVSSASISGTGFTFAGANFPLTLSSNQTATLSVQFDPTTAGAAAGQLTITSNSTSNPTAAIALTGTGDSTTAYNVDLTWTTPSSSTDPVAGYNIYRAPSGSSSYQLMGSVSSATLAYTDANNVLGGQIYDYIVESVDASGNESVPSNMASVSIP